MALSLLAALLLTAQPAPSAKDQAALTRTVEALFHPYFISPARPAPAVWERPIWSHETAALIARWRKVTPKDEVDALSDGDWLCQCQDWDEHAFRLDIRSRHLAAPNHATVEVHFEIVRGESRWARLSMVREGGAWKLDEMVDQEHPAGLKAALRRTIAEDQRR